MHKAWCCIEEVPYCFPRSSIKFQGHTGQKIANFDPNWAFPDCNSIFSCNQAALWMVQSVRPSIRLSVRLSVTLFLLCYCSHHRIIMKFSGDITDDRSDVHAKDQGQRSKVKVTEVNTQLSRFRTVTHIWWNDAQSLMLFRRGALLFFKVICQISRTHC